MFAMMLALTTMPAHAGGEITPITGYVLSEPRVAYMSDGTFCVNYELVIANATTSAYTIEEIQVIDTAKPDTPVVTLNKDDFARYVYVPGAERPVSKLLPAQSGYVKINLTFGSEDAIPKEIEHVITASADTPNPMVPEPAVGKVGRAAILQAPVITIGPPLRGRNWVAAVVGGHEYHRNTVMPIGGNWVAPERWAVDYIQLTEDGRLITGPVENNESYPQYGKEIIAVADGSVESARDGMPDIPAGKAPELISLNDAAGNYIVQDIGGGFYALYAHLQPGSLKVQKGDAVKKGQAIALLGNSGNTTGPHLHFHVIHGPWPLGSDGVPYVIDSFTVRGAAVSNDALQADIESGNITTVTPAEGDGKREMKMPANVAVVDF